MIDVLGMYRPASIVVLGPGQSSIERHLNSALQAKFSLVRIVPPLSCGMATFHTQTSTPLSITHRPTCKQKLGCYAGLPAQRML